MMVVVLICKIDMHNAISLKGKFFLLNISFLKLLQNDACLKTSATVTRSVVFNSYINQSRRVIYLKQY